MVMSTPICAMACVDTKVLALIATSTAAKKIRFMSATFLVSAVLATIVIVVMVIIAATTNWYDDTSG
jgi:hypothetical protein